MQGSTPTTGVPVHVLLPSPHTPALPAPDVSRSRVRYGLAEEGLGIASFMPHGSVYRISHRGEGEGGVGGGVPWDFSPRICKKKLMLFSILLGGPRTNLGASNFLEGGYPQNPPDSTYNIFLAPPPAKILGLKTVVLVLPPFVLLHAHTHTHTHTHTHAFTCTYMLTHSYTHKYTHTHTHPPRHHMSPLMYACQKGRQSLAQLLLSTNADINKQDTRGWTVSITTSSITEFNSNSGPHCWCFNLNCVPHAISVLVTPFYPSN